MEKIKFNDINYYTLKEVYENLCVARTSIVKKISRLEKEGYILRIKNKRPSIYISEEGYELLKRERIEYLDEQIKTSQLRGYFVKLKEAIGHPELWSEYHDHEIGDNLYFDKGELVAIEKTSNGKKYCIEKIVINGGKLL